MCQVGGYPEIYATVSNKQTSKNYMEQENTGNALTWFFFEILSNHVWLINEELFMNQVNQGQLQIQRGKSKGTAASNPRVEATQPAPLAYA